MTSGEGEWGSLAERALRARANGGVEPGIEGTEAPWWLSHLCKDRGRDGWPILIADRSTRLECPSDLKKWLQRIGAPEGSEMDRKVSALWADLINGNGIGEALGWWSDDIILIKSGWGYNMKTGEIVKI